MDSWWKEVLGEKTSFKATTVTINTSRNGAVMYGSYIPHRCPNLYGTCQRWHQFVIGSGNISALVAVSGGGDLDSGFCLVRELRGKLRFIVNGHEVLGLTIIF